MLVYGGTRPSACVYVYTDICIYASIRAHALHWRTHADSHMHAYARVYAHLSTLCRPCCSSLHASTSRLTHNRIRQYPYIHARACIHFRSLPHQLCIYFSGHQTQLWNHLRAHGISIHTQTRNRIYAYMRVCPFSCDRPPPHSYIPSGRSFARWRDGANNGRQGRYFFPQAARKQRNPPIDPCRKARPNFSTETCHLLGLTVVGASNAAGGCAKAPGGVGRRCCHALCPRTGALLGWLCSVPCRHSLPSCAWLRIPRVRMPRAMP